MSEKEYTISKLIRNRWSPRAMSGEALKEEEYMPIFEAARWAPSSYNAQPWRFLVTKMNSDSYDKLYSVLTEGNKAWAKNASLLVLLSSRKNFEKNGNPSVTHSFDCGAAWENLALEGHERELVIHGMQGFDYEKTRELFSIPDQYNIEMMFAVGKPGEKTQLPEDYQKSEAPKNRKSLEEIVAFENFTFV